MNRANIRELATYMHTPGVSLYASTQQSLYQLCKDACAMTESLDSHLTDMVHLVPTRVTVDERYATTVIFINRYGLWSYHIASSIVDQVHVQRGFVTYPIEQHLYRIDRYWVVVIFHGIPYLFEGYETHVTEASYRHMTMGGEVNMSLQDTAGLVCDTTAWGKKCRYRSAAEFIAAIDTMMMTMIEHDPLPVVIIGDRESLMWFEQYSQIRDHCKVSSLTHERPSLEDIYERSFTLIDTWLSQRRHRVYHELQEGLRAHVCVREIPRIWHYLHDDSVRYVAIDRTLYIPGCEDRIKSEIFLGESCQHAESVDAVDAVLITAHRRGVPVILFHRGGLESFQGAAALLSGGQESLVS